MRVLIHVEHLMREGLQNRRPLSGYKVGTGITLIIQLLKKEIPEFNGFVRKTCLWGVPTRMDTNCPA